MNRQAVGQFQAEVAAQEVQVRRARMLMGTFVGVTVRGPETDVLEHAIRKVFVEMERLEAMLSEWRPDSAVSRVNQSAGKAPVRAPAELIAVLEVAGRVSRATEGAFDSTWAALSNLWRLDEPNFRPPESDLVAAARKLVDYRDVVLDVEGQTVFLRRPGMRLGLGGIAKAYIAERGADLAVAEGVHHILIDAGGDLVARGRRGERPWTVGVRDPRSASHLLATLDLDHEVVATSGDYARFVEVDGHRFHHLLDPRTGYPALVSRSATVVARDGALAEALSTALFVLGPRGLAISSAFPETATLLVDDKGGVHLAASGSTRFRVVGEDAAVAGP
jgi:thiamine biosynthesis lipoprotein